MAPGWWCKPTPPKILPITNFPDFNGWRDCQVGLEVSGDLPDRLTKAPGAIDNESVRQCARTNHRQHDCRSR